MGANKLEPKIDYQEMERRRIAQLQNQLESELKQREVGKVDSLRRTVLHLVASGQYEYAIDVIGAYIAGKSEYPSVAERSEVHSRHAKELVNAIRTKRNFPNLSHLSMSKQQEIIDHAVSHYEELKNTLKAIEAIARDEILKDLRSSVWVVRTFAYVVMGVVVVIFLGEFHKGLAMPFWHVFSDFSEKAFKFINQYLPWL